MISNEDIEYINALIDDMYLGFETIMKYKKNHQISIPDWFTDIDKSEYAVTRCGEYPYLSIEDFNKKLIERHGEKAEKWIKKEVENDS